MGATVTGYLKLDSTRLSYAEYWRWKPGLPFLILASRKALGWPLEPKVLVPAVPALDIGDPQAQPPELVGALVEAIEVCETRGRAVEFWYTVPTIGSNVGLAAALRSRDSMSMAVAAVSRARSGVFREVLLGLVTRLRGGKFLATGSGKSLFSPPPEVDQLRLQWRSYDQVVDAHDRRVESRSDAILPCGDLRELILEMQRLQINANVARGVYVPASPNDVERLKRHSASVVGR